MHVNINTGISTLNHISQDPANIIDAPLAEKLFLVENRCLKSNKIKNTTLTTHRVNSQQGEKKHLKLQPLDTLERVLIQSEPLEGMCTITFTQDLGNKDCQI